MNIKKIDEQFNIQFRLFLLECLRGCFKQVSSTMTKSNLVSCQPTLKMWC